MMSGGNGEDVAHAVPQGPEYDDLEGYLEITEFETLQEGHNIFDGITLSKSPTCDCAPEQQRKYVKLYYIDHDDDNEEVLYLWVGEERIPYLFSTSVGWLENELLGLSFVRSDDALDYESEFYSGKYDWIFNDRDALERFIETGEQPDEQPAE